MKKRVVTAGDMRRLEQRVVDSGVTYEELMYRAGTSVATMFCKELYCPSKKKILIVCGNGNNGGDGFVIAEKLSEMTDAQITVLLVSGEPTVMPAKWAYDRLRKTTVNVIDLTDMSSKVPDEIERHRPDYVIDAVYGIGFHGSFPNVVCDVFDRVRDTSCIVAVDIPSGMNADSGVVAKGALRAHKTVTFTALKPAMLSKESAMCGDITVADIGIDDGLTETFETRIHFTTTQDVMTALPPRPRDGHKGSFGKVLCVCGSYGMAGAAMLCATAALRSGAGLVTAAIPRSIYPIVAAGVWEAVFCPLDETPTGTLCENSLSERLLDDKQAVVVGCGLSCSQEVSTALCRWLPSVNVPLIIDADGLNCLNGHIDVLKAIQAPLVLTPHPAEMARLLGTTVAAVERDRVAAAKQLAELCGATVVLKGHRTVIAAEDGDVWINETGCSGMATGGSGDILSGMIGAFAARIGSLTDAATAAVYLHGLCGEETARRLSHTGMLPSDMFDTLPKLLSQFECVE